MGTSDKVAPAIEVKGRILLEWTGQGRMPWTLAGPITVQDSVTKIKVPGGMVTDLASVPRALWALFPPYGSHLLAALVHDYLYQSRLVDRRRADAIFLSLMLQGGTAPWRAKAMYAAVRLFGGMSWGN